MTTEKPSEQLQQKRDTQKPKKNDLLYKRTNEICNNNKTIKI